MDPSTPRQFKPDYAGQLGIYVVSWTTSSASPRSTPTRSASCCARAAATPSSRYAPANTTAPMAVANYRAQPAEAAQLSLPAPAEFEAILAEPIAGRPGSTLAGALPDDVDE